MSSKRAVRRKSCAGKVRHATSEAAEVAARALRRDIGRDGGLLTAYRCKFCNGFHMGHAPKRVRQSIRAKARTC